MSLIDAIPATMKQIGGDRASGAAAKGGYGRSLAQIGQMVAELPDLTAKRNIQAMEQAKLQRESLADAAINSAMSSALQPDGSVDMAKLGQALAGGPAASAFPKLSEAVTKMQQSAVELKSSRIDAQTAEDDSLGALAHSAAVLEHPEDRAGWLTTGLASMVKSGTLAPERAKQITADMLNDEGEPDETKIGSLLEQMQAASNKQRTMAATDAQKEAAAASAQSLADQRQLANASRQLGAATTKERYAQVYRGLPAQMKNYFDPPESWSAESTQRAQEVGMSPAERETGRHNKITEAAATALRNETARHNKAIEAKSTKDGADDDYKRDFEQYKVWIGQWAERERRKPGALDPKTGQPKTDFNGRPLPAEYVPAPTFDEWKAGGKGTKLEEPDRPGVADEGDIPLPASKGPVATAAAVKPPAGLKVGQTVTFQDGTKGKVTAIHPNGFVDYEKVH